MKITIGIATFLVVGAGAAGAGALAEPNPYQGSDTLFNVTRQSLTSLGLVAADYVGGGSGNGEAAMDATSPTQTTAPMSRMMKGSGVCGFAGGTHGSKATNASGIVVGLDAVDILGSTNTAASTACGGGSAGGNGILNSGGAISATTWKDALALVYGGKNNQTGTVDCNQTARINLVAKWSSLFQNASCSNTLATCQDGNHTAGTGTGIVSGQVPLWHAWRRDETSGTSDVFSSILGLSPSTSASSLNGFGASPFCNALNWDTTTTNATCLPTAGGPFNPHGQFIGPGGVFDTDGVHKMPPPGLGGPVWGSQPDTTQTYKGQVIAFDVLPTDMQDNDPIRRQCYGGTVAVNGHIGEDVCNIDGSLGLVLPLVDTDFVATVADPVHAGKFLDQYPPVSTQACSGAFANGSPPNVFSCAAANITHPGECPNGDVLGSGACVYPIAAGGFGQCTASNSTQTGLFNRTAASSADGRVFNLFLTSGSTANGGITLIQQNIPADGLTIDFAGGFNRIHQVDVAVSGATPCQMVDMTDQIGCLGQADPCSIGYAGDGGKQWNTHTAAPGGPTNPATSGIDAANIFGVYPQTSSVQLLGESNEYPLSRKLYFNSLPGFSTVTLDELTLAKFEAGGSGGTTPFDTIITNNDFFLLGAQAGPQTAAAGVTSGVTGGTAGVQFCEDFDETVVCNPTLTAASTLPANINACTGNPSGVPTVNTDCGNGKQEAFEECDDGASNGTSVTGEKCSSTCRCTTFLNSTTGKCN